jgi:acetyl-CoA carboxylase biotin carboxyl carrier protein
MKIEDLIRLVEALQNSNFDEFVLEAQELKMTLRRGSKVEYVQMPLAPVQAVPAEALAPVAAEQPAPAAPEAGLIEVTAPMVGTYYQAATPGADFFANPGSKVKVGDTLCILEAMKLMNEIQAEVEGEVVQIFAKNGELVEYGQVLMTIRPIKS